MFDFSFAACYNNGRNTRKRKIDDRRRTAENFNGRREVRRFVFLFRLAAEKRTRRLRQRRVRRYMPFVRGGRQMHLSSENFNVQRLRFRLQVLPQPPQCRRKTRHAYARRNLRTHRRFLPPQLYRRACSCRRRCIKAPITPWNF